MAWRGAEAGFVGLEAGMMKHYVPEVTEVVEVQDESQKVGESEFAKLEKQLSA